MYCDQLRFVREYGGLSPLSQLAYQVILTCGKLVPVVELDCRTSGRTVAEAMSGELAAVIASMSRSRSCMPCMSGYNSTKGSERWANERRCSKQYMRRTKM